MISSNQKQQQKIIKENNLTEKQFKENSKKIEKAIMSSLIKKINIENRSVPVDNDKANKDDNGINLIDTKSFMDYEYERYEELAEERVDIVKWQKNAFFWIPGELFITCDSINTTEKIELKGEKSDKAMYIAFFYAWLRQCSFATPNEIALETGVKRHSTVSRDWKPHKMLAEPFPKLEKNSTRAFCSVYFSREARRTLGMFDRTIRCYVKQDYSSDDYKNNILSRKYFLWAIYNDFLKQNDIIDESEIRYAKNAERIFPENNFKILYEYVSNSDINLHPGKRYFLIHIKELKLMREKNENSHE